MQKRFAITSAQNRLLKEARRAAARGALTEDGCCVAEGVHLLEEALRSGVKVQAVLAAEDAVEKALAALGGAEGVRLAVAPRALIEQIAATEHTQGVIALVRAPEWKEEELWARSGPVVVLDELQDPGNAGAVARAAEAFGAAGLVWIKGTVSRWNGKVVRASAGSLFRLPVIASGSAAEAAAMLRSRGCRILAAEARGGKAPWEADWRGRCAVVIGNEARGASGEWAAARVERVSIPTRGVESLNAAVAAAVILYEAMRQRGAE
ncbi:MAG: RNA methyltransferase [Bryobacteraceae bacterium]|jgi:TrmH family RNA methyltransferase